MSNNNKQNKAAIIYMGAYVLLASMMALVYSIGNASKFPFMFSAIAYFFSSIICISYAISLKPNQRTVKLIKTNLLKPAIIFVVLGNIGFAAFPYSLKYINVAVANIIAQTGTLFMVLFTASLLKYHKTYNKITKSILFVFLMGLVGISLVILSQIPQSKNISDVLLSGNLIIGIFLALITALCNGILPAYSLKWAADIQSEAIWASDYKYKIFFVIIALAVARSVAAVIQFILGIVVNETIDLNGFMIAAGFGIAIAGIGTIFHQIANTKTRNLGINSMTYAAPATSLIWLGLASLINVPRIDWLIIGLSLIIISNILLNIKISPNKNESR